jgi:hypothetical protein
METATALVPSDADACWRVFTDASLLTSWVPGLRRAQILTKERGMASEIHFEFSSTLAYTLVYSYDKTKREVRWQPKLGPREGVSGFARFEAEAEGTRITYGLEQGDARSADERALGDPAPLLEAFAKRMRAD